MLTFVNVSKIYKKGNKEEFYALKDFSFRFDKKGMYCILGKSGSGKSTIANLAALLDAPTHGEIKYCGQEINKFKQGQINNYRSKIVSIVFQHYNLLPDLNVIENIILPRLAIQEDPKAATQDAIELLEKLGFCKDFGQKSCKDLSGGEAQRVAILRAIINNPEIIIADEPTGALDEANSILIMDLLKKISKKKIVILISHNKNLVNKYADEILYLKDGELEKVEVIKSLEQANIIDVKKPRLGRHKKWMYNFALKRLKSHKSKNLLSCCSIVVGLISIFTIIGFSNGSRYVIEEKSHQRFDYNVGDVSKTETIELEDSFMNLTKKTRLKAYEINDLKTKYPFINYDINFDALFANNVLKINNLELSGIGVYFINSFDDDYVNKNLIFEGQLGKENQVIINENAAEIIANKLNSKNLVGRDLYLSSRYELSLKDNDKIINDEFKFNKFFKIAGVSREFSFLATPKIFFSYQYFKSLLEMDVVENYSQFIGKETSWFRYIEQADNSNEITSFSHKVFIKNNDIVVYENLIENLDTNSDINIDSQPYLLKDTFASLMHSIEIGLIVFSCLAIIGTVLIIGINAFSSYTFERKHSAIYFAFGVSKDQIFNIFILESVLITIFAFMVSIIGSFGLETLINMAIFKYFNITNMVMIPFNNFHNIPGFLIVASLICALFTCIVFTYLPLMMSKKINLRKELGDE